MRISRFLILAAIISNVLTLAAPAGLIGRYKLDSSSGLQLDSSGVSPAADAFQQALGSTNHLYNQPGVPGGTYGGIVLPTGTISASAGFASTVPTASTDHWLISTSASLGTVTAPTRFNGLLNNFTVMGWIKPNTAKTQRIFSTQVNGVAHHVWGFGMTSALKLRFTDFSQYDSDTTPSPIVLNQWQHIAATKSSSGVSFYYNGNLIHTDAATSPSRLINVTAAPTSATNWRLMNGPNNEIFLGLAAEIRVYDNVLTQSEIQFAAGHQPTATGVLAADFYPPSNPFLGFSHGVKASVGSGALTVFTTTGIGSANKPANRFNDASDNLWVGKAPATVGNVSFPAAGGTNTDWLSGNVYHAWSGGRADNLTSRYTVPTTGYYDVSAAWKSHTQPGCKAQVYAVLNGTTLFSAAINGFVGTLASTVAPVGPAPTAAFAQPGMSLTAGDTLDIITVPDATTPNGNLAIDFSVIPGTAPVSSGGLLISEFVASNTRSLKDEDGSYPDWIEIYNGTGAAVDLTDWSLTDNVASPHKWNFPARSLPHGGFLVVFASNKDASKRPFYGPTSQLHTNFQLSGSGEYLALVNPAGTVVDSFAPTFPAQVPDVAYGRSGSVGAIGFLIPTPNRVNGSIASAPPGTVTFSSPSGTYAPTAPQNVTLTVSPAGQTIRYTINNTEPTLSNGTTYSGTPLAVTGTSIVRARAFVDGVAGPMAEARYLFVDPTVQPDLPDTYRLPVVVIDTLNTGALGDFSNATEDLQKAALVAVYEPDATGKTVLTGAPKVLTRGASHVRGQSSSTYKKQGLDLELWDELGLDRSEPLLGMPSNGDWALYAPYEFDRTYMNNRLTYEMAARMGRYAPRTKFVEVYVNPDGGPLTASDYYGIYVLSESIEVDKDRIDVAPLNPTENSGTDVTGGYLVSINKSNEAETVLAASLPNMRHMRQFTANITLTGGMTTFLDYPEITAVTPAQISYIDGYLKTVEDSIYGANFMHPTTNLPYTDYIGRDTFIDFHMAQTIPQNIDALRLSTFFYKEKNGKLKAGPVWDFDRSMASRDGRNAVPAVWDTLTSLDKTEYFHYGWWHRLFQDPDFMQLWVDRYVSFRQPGKLYDMNGSVLPMINGYAAEVAPVGSTVNAASRDYARWPFGASGSGTGLSNARAAYDTEVTALKTWLQNRFTFIDSQILALPVPSVSAGVIPTATTVTFNLTGASGAAQIIVTTNGSDPRLPGGAVNPAATVLSSGGSITVNSTQLVRYRQLDTTAPAFNSNLTTTKMATWSGLGETYYIVGAARPVPGNLTISQLHYHPADPSPAEITAGFTDADQFEFIELQNISGHRLNLEGCRFTAGVDFTMPIGNLTELAAGDRVLILKNTAAFSQRYGASFAAMAIGEFSGNDNLNNAGETLTLTAPDGLTTLLTCTYDDAAPWPTEADGLGPCLVLRAPFSNPPLSDPLSWRPSTDIGGAPVVGDGLHYAQWKSTNTIPSDTADDDHDGVLPLVEYALGSNPAVPSQTALPAFSTETDGTLTIQFSRALTADDVRWEVQTCDDLGAWTPTPFSITTRAFTATTEDLTLSLPASTGNRRFVRLNFTSAP